MAVALDLAPGRTVVVVGPNGAGKTTLLRRLAEESTDRVGVVHQDLRLFPHLTALDNVAYGLRRRGLRRAEARRRAAEWLARVGVAERADARPAELSGGEAQRVALARALAPEPQLLLLDEPLSALDAVTRPAVRRLLAEHLRAFAGPRVLVSHDAVDAMTLADTVVVLEAGEVTQSGSPEEVRARPRSPYVAELVGVNLLRGTAAAGAVRIGDATLTAAEAPDGDVLVSFHPHAVALHAGPPGGSPRNLLHGTVRSLHSDGHRVRVEIDAAVPLVAEVTAAAAEELRLAEGVDVWAAVKATELRVEPA
ncbi:MAG TPA: ABC transporter ATP-binding protein [Acidimicrobiales bacterium]|nr:ABC transporter ATP-binding protein [Acidimicrobiales bacterium]